MSNSNSLLEGRVYRVFGIFMIFIYAGLGIGMLFAWTEVNNHTAIGILLLAWTGFRIYMLFRYKARMKQSNSNANP